MVGAKDVASQGSRSLCTSALAVEVVYRRQLLQRGDERRAPDLAATVRLEMRLRCYDADFDAL